MPGNHVGLMLKEFLGSIKANVVLLGIAPEQLYSLPYPTAKPVAICHIQQVISFRLVHTQQSVIDFQGLLVLVTTRQCPG